MDAEFIQERVWIHGPRGRLAGELAYGTGAPQASAILLSPHPYMGGRMNLPLLSSLAARLASSNITTLRFDYGGVGDSEGPRLQLGSAMQQFWSTGSAPEDPLCIEEALAARNWLDGATSRKSAVVGYSFGSYVASRIQTVAEAAALVMIAPTIARHDYSGLRNDATPTLIIYGSGDFATSDAQLREWSARLSGQTRIRHFPAGDHFFRGLEADVALTVTGFIEETCRNHQELSS